MKPVVLLTLLALLLSACGSSKSLHENIFLYFTPNSLQTDKSLIKTATFPLKVQVRKLKISPLYDNQNIVLRSGDYSVSFIRRAEWAVRPHQAASDMLIDYLKSHFQFKTVRESFSDDVPDLVISGEMKAVEEDGRTPSRSATLILTLRASLGREERLLFEETYSKNLSVKKSGYDELAKTFSLALSDIYSAFSAHLEKSLAVAPERAQ
ncbi:MAG: hypothetical protein A2293_13610 [Elusimicrobia bacterium RIFOXYB2_FULL_49_7]|nr:MAG: hypothetical protein A2293_13610 [Elusimicrobia bacterium RIFOXYB2_FULL_49_7]